jgi:tetratricopeptide (TPR) repeat protein
MGRLELPRGRPRWNLNPVRLPISPHPQLPSVYQDGTLIFVRTTFVFVLCLGLAACGPTLPKLPDIDFSPFPPAVRQAIEKAHSDAEFTPGDAIRAAELAKGLHAHNFYDAAAVYYKHARQLDPSNATYAHLHGVSLSERGNYPDALEAFSAALARKSDAPATRFAMAAAQLAAGGTVEAGATYRALGDHPVAHLGLGRTLQGNAQVDEFKRALALEPRYGAAWKALADAYRAKGETEKAAEADRAYARYRSFEPSTGDVELMAVRELNLSPAGLRARAERAENESRLLDATKLLEQVVTNEPNNDAPAAQLIRIYVRLKDHAAAAKVYDQARLRNPESAALATANGLLLIATQRAADAKPFLEKAIALDPSQADAWFQLGLAADAEGAAQRALDCFGRTLDADPAHRAARYHAAIILLKYKREAQAREQLERALQGPEDELTARVRQTIALLPKA